MQRCVIVGGAAIENYTTIRASLRSEDFMIYCDCGLRHRKGLDRKPHLIVGDFDSHPNPMEEIETIVLPREKDDTDTVFAVKEALRRGFEEFLLVGMVGQRIDHTLGNLSILLMLHNAGKKAMILDDYSEMEIVSSTPAFIRNHFSYFSLLNISGTAEGITVENAKYPLENAVITCDYPYGISNEVLPGKTASVKLTAGRLLLVRVR